MDNNTRLNEQLIDAAACEALGATTSAESAGYQQELAASGETARKLDRQLRETVARMATASPYMEPPADLRGRILQATAPTTFKMEDYRKVQKDTGRFFRWGFYAAMVALAAGAAFNVNLRSQLSTAHQQVASAQQQIDVRNTALAKLVDPNTDQISLVQNGQVTGKAFVDDVTHTAVLIVPKGSVPDGKSAVLTLDRNGQKQEYKTVMVAADAATFEASPKTPLASALTVRNVQVIPSRPTYTAVMGQ